MASEVGLKVKALHWFCYARSHDDHHPLLAPLAHICCYVKKCLKMHIPALQKPCATLCISGAPKWSKSCTQNVFCLCCVNFHIDGDIFGGFLTPKTAKIWKVCKLIHT